MRILRVIPTLDTANGGPVEGLTQQGVQLVARGHEADVLTLDVPGAPYDARLNYGKVFQIGPSIFNSYRYNASLVPWLLEHVREYDIVIVHGIWGFHGLAVWRAAQQLKFPYVVFLHGMLDPWFKHQYPLKHLKKWLYWPWAEYRVLRDARYVLYTTAEELQLARQSFWLFKARERLVGYGIARRSIAPGAAAEIFLAAFPALRGKRNWLYLSRIHPKKGCDLLIEAFAAQAAADPLLHLVIVGPEDAEFGPVLRALADRLGLNERITYTGLLRGDLKWGAYDAAEVFILPSHQENFGIVVAEALASGLPVLTTNKVNIWREIQESKAGFIANDDLAGTRTLMESWVALTPSQQAVMRENALRCFESHFEIGNVAGHLHDALQDAVSGPLTDFTFPIPAQ